MVIGLFCFLILITKSHSQFNCTSGTVNDVCIVSSDIKLSSSTTISGSGAFTLSAASLTCPVAECTITLSFPSGTVTIQAGTLSAQWVSVSASRLTVAPDGVISAQDGVTGRGSGLGALCNNACGTGGGFGGSGGPCSSGCNGGPPYQSDNLAHPLSLGSGGNGGGNAGCNTAGGGIVFLNIGSTITINGIIQSIGQTAVCNVAGGGSGGSIQINASTITCDVCNPALVTANGGLGSDNGGDGGGGRIAIKYTTLSSSIKFTAYGGAGKYPGGPGTIYDLVTNTLLFDGGSSASAPLPTSQGRIPSFAKNVQLRNYAMVGITSGVTLTLDSILVAATCVLSCDNSCVGCSCDTVTFSISKNISVEAGATLSALASLTLSTVSGNTAQAIIAGTVKSGKITVSMSSVIIASGAVLTVDGGGSNSGSGPGAGASCPGGYGGGAGYGGVGGNSGSQCPAGVAYGSSNTAPSQAGSGGGDSSLSGGGGKGGGLVIMNVPSLTLEGTISAQGAAGNNNGGGGSGGGVSIVGNVNCQSCARPQALVVASGGNGYAGNGGGGGGGRIYFNGIISQGIDVQTLPGQGAGTAQGGTVYLLCPNGQYPTGLQCNPCSAGSFGTANQCYNCNAGTYSNKTASTVCTSCTSGTYNNKAQSTNCVACNQGYYSRSSGLTKCDTCLAGTYSNSSASVCKQCQPGYYQSVNASSGCNNCTAGTWAGLASTACFSCPADHYSADLAGSCNKCGFGQSANPTNTGCKLAAWVLNVSIIVGVLIFIPVIGILYYKRYKKKQREEKLMEATFEEERATPSVLPWRSMDDEDQIGGKFRELDDDDDDTSSLKKKAKNVGHDADAVNGSTDVLEAFNQKYGSTKGKSSNKSSYSSKSKGSTATKSSTNKSSSTKTSTSSSTSKPKTTAASSRTSTLKESIFGQDKPAPKTYKSKPSSALRKKQEQRKRDVRSALLGRGGGGGDGDESV